MTSTPSRSRSSPATAVFPDAVGPKSARTLRAGAGGELEAMLDLVGRLRADERAVLLRMRGAPLLEPGDRARDADFERRLRLPPEQLARLADVGHVVRHLAEERGRDRDRRLHVELAGDQLGRADEGVSLAVGEVDRLVRGGVARQGVDAAGDAVDAVVDVGEVEYLLVAAEDGDRLAA